MKRDALRLAPGKRRGRLRRGMYIVPSLFTSGNIAAGYFAIMQSLQGSVQEPQHFNYAALAIGFAIPFDAIDGRIARMTKTTSEFGKELDSLADVITFGVAPSLLAFTWGFQMLPMAMDSVKRHYVVDWGAFVCFLFLLCGAGRLARFNIGGNLLPCKPGPPGPKILRWHAYPSCRRSDCRRSSLLPGNAGAQLASGHHVDAAGVSGWTAYGQYLALLEWKRNQLHRSSSVPAHRGDRTGNLRHRGFLAIRSLRDGLLLHVFRHLRPCRLLLAAPPPADDDPRGAATGRTPCAPPIPTAGSSVRVLVDR